MAKHTLEILQCSQKFLAIQIQLCLHKGKKSKRNNTIDYMETGRELEGSRNLHGHYTLLITRDKPLKSLVY